MYDNELRLWRLQLGSSPHVAYGSRAVRAGRSAIRSAIAQLWTQVGEVGQSCSGPKPASRAAKIR